LAKRGSFGDIFGERVLLIFLHIFSTNLFHLKV